jgi:hypothetical protein
LLQTIESLVDYEYIYDSENNVFHYVPFDFAGNRIYTGQTIDANTVGGFDPTEANTGTTKAIMTDPVTGQPVVEHSGDGSITTTDDTTNETGSTGSSLNITLTGSGLVDGIIKSVLYGPFQTQAEEDAAAAANNALNDTTIDTTVDTTDTTTDTSTSTSTRY